jgi:hypothetical protein
MVHRCARAAQSSQQTIGKHLVVFGYQNAHVCLLLLWRRRWAVCPGCLILVSAWRKT